MVSTHAPLAGSDREGGPVAVGLDVSTHAPLAGSDRAVRVRDPRAVRFQPTLPLRGATPPSLPAVSSSNLFQPTLPLRGATRCWGHDMAATSQFQPTLPLRGATERRVGCLGLPGFQPTLPLRGATRRINEALIECGFQPTLPSAPRCTTHPVSTHAPLAGSDIRTISLGRT